jgi:hypothetical protein
MGILTLLVAVLLMFTVLYFGGWIKRSDVQNLGAFARKSSGTLVVFAMALMLTRNLGLAILAATFAYSYFSFRDWKPYKDVFERYGGGARSQTTSPRMSLKDAYDYLGLKEGATREEVLAAHRNLIRRNHPDQGGSTHIAAKVNEAKDVLLKHIAA